MHSNYLEPEQLTAVKEVYDDIVAQDWFSSTEEARSSFARYLIDTYAIDRIEPSRFRKIVEFSARAHYSRLR